MSRKLISDSKIVTSVYDKGFDGSLNGDMQKKIAFDGIKADKISSLEMPDYNNLLKVAVDYSDAVILASEGVSDDLTEYISKQDKPVLPYVSFQEAEEAYSNFYNTEVLK